VLNLTTELVKELTVINLYTKLQQNSYSYFASNQEYAHHYSQNNLLVD